MQDNNQDVTQDKVQNEIKQDGVQRLFAPRQASQPQTDTQVSTQVSAQDASKDLLETEQQKANEAAVQAANAVPTDAVIFNKRLQEQGPSNIISLDKGMASGTDGRTGKISLWNTMSLANKQQAVDQYRTFSRDEMRNKFQEAQGVDKQLADITGKNAVAAEKRYAGLRERFGDINKYQDVSKDAFINDYAKLLTMKAAMKAVKDVEEADASYSKYKDVVERIGNNYKLMNETYKTDAMFADAASRMTSAEVQLAKTMKEADSKVYEKIASDISKASFKDTAEFRKFNDTVQNLYSSGDITNGERNHLIGIMQASLPQDIKDEISSMGIDEKDGDYYTVAEILSSNALMDTLRRGAKGNDTVVYNGRALSRERTAVLLGKLKYNEMVDRRNREASVQALSNTQERLANVASAVYNAADNFGQINDASIADGSLRKMLQSGSSETFAYYDKELSEAAKGKPYEATWLVVKDGRHSMMSIPLEVATRDFSTSQQKSALEQYVGSNLAKMYDVRRKEYDALIAGFVNNPDRDKILQKLVDSIKAGKKEITDEDIGYGMSAQFAMPIIRVLNESGSALNTKTLPKWEDIKDAVFSSILNKPIRARYDANIPADAQELAMLKKAGIMPRQVNGNGNQYSVEYSADVYASVAIAEQIVRGRYNANDIMGRPDLLTGLRIVAPGLSLKQVEGIVGRLQQTENWQQIMQLPQVQQIRGSMGKQPQINSSNDVSMPALIKARFGG